VKVNVVVPLEQLLNDGPKLNATLAVFQLFAVSLQ
jgi:hypothetical protein